MDELHWSAERTLNTSGPVYAPNAPGVYPSLQGDSYLRYRGRTRILYIGNATDDIRARLAEKLGPQTIATASGG